MPYKIKGNSVVKANTGKLVGHSSNPKKYLRVLQAVEHGWKPNRSGISKLHYGNSPRKRSKMWKQ